MDSTFDSCARNSNVRVSFHEAPVIVSDRTSAGPSSQDSEIGPARMQVQLHIMARGLDPQRQFAHRPIAEIVGIERFDEKSRLGAERRECTGGFGPDACFGTGDTGEEGEFWVRTHTSKRQWQEWSLSRGV